LGYIYNEIQGQYESLERTGSQMERQSGQIRAVLNAHSGPLVYIGSGSSFCIARSAAFAARIPLGREAIALAAGDLLLRLDTYAPLLHDSIVIAFSRSGETSELVQTIDSLRKRGVEFFLLAFSCVENSTLSLQSNLAIDLPWAFDKSVCQTRTVSSLYYASLNLLAIWSGNATLSAHLHEVVERGDDFLERYEADFQQIAHMDWSHAVVLGDAELNGLCEEGALAFKEICQLPSNNYHLLDVRHGPMVLIGSQTLVIVALSDSDNPLETGLLMDLLDKGATVIACGDQPTGMARVHDVSFGAPLHHAVRGLPLIATCQMIAYYKALERGVDPDKPEGLRAWIKL